MGLDTVELVMNVEKHFGIHIPDKEAERILTVQDFADCVCKYVNVNSHAKCKSQYLFYVLREYFVTEYLYDRIRFKPSTPIDDVIPMDGRDIVWDKLTDDFKMKLPSLRFGDVRNDKSIFEALFFSPDKPIADYTVRDMVNWILALNHEKLIGLESIFSREEVYNVIVGIISYSCGINVVNIEPHHKIVDDLGIN